MARGQRELASTDFLPADSELEGVIDFEDLKVNFIARNIDVVPGADFETVAERESFMNERIVIVINKTSDVNAPPVVAVGVNGDTRWLPRGRKIRIPRKFAEVLGRSEFSYDSISVPDPLQSEGYKQRLTANQPYPFMLISDANPKGRAWYERAMRGA